MSSSTRSMRLTRNRADGNAPAITCNVQVAGSVTIRVLRMAVTRRNQRTAKRREELKLLITKAFGDSDGTYGYRRVGRSWPAGACGPGRSWSVP